MSDVFAQSMAGNNGAGRLSPPRESLEEQQQSVPDRQKFSRYRSVRNAPAPPKDNSPPPASTGDGAAAVKRSMSRYKGRRSTNPPAHTPTMPKLDRGVIGHAHTTSNEQRDAVGVKSGQRGCLGVANESPAGAGFSNEAQQEAYRKLTGEEIDQRPKIHAHGGLGKEGRPDKADQIRRRTEEEQSHSRAQQRLEDHSGAGLRRVATEPFSGPRHGQAGPKPDASRRPSGGARHVQPRTPPSQGQPAAKLVTSPESISNSGKDQIAGSPARRKPSTDSPARQAGFDAPISAVNAGTRTVILECNGVHISLLVDPSTTPMDLLYAAEVKLPEDVDPSTALLAESFSQLGLERPLRHYEHVRDVMNSWDRDGQHTLQVLASSELGEGVALRREDAPRDRPGDTSVHMYYSHKPGSWDKRWVTLRSDGQVVLAKDANALAKDQKNICHMTDFDVYMPTARRLKKLRPPRKYCIAIKSQEKSAMFESTANFVHFFCAKDKELTRQWYQAAQRWRSWYMITQMGMGGAGKEKSASRSSTAAIATAHPPRTTSRPPAPPTNRLSAAPQQPAFGSHFVRPAAPPPSLARKLTKSPPLAVAAAAARLSIIQKPPPKPAADPFAAGGLLGRTYSQRQKALQDRAGERVAWPGPQVATGAGTANFPLGDSDFLQPGGGGGGGGGEGGSGGGGGVGPKPLLDLGPAKFLAPPPQHAPRAHARQPARSASGSHGGLVAGARNADGGLDLPLHAEAVDGSGGATLLGSLARPSLEGGRQSGEVGRTSVDGGRGGEGPGLSRRSGTVRRSGTLKGRREGEPLLDLAKPAEFVPGSLLAGVQKYENENERGPLEGIVKLKNGAVIDTSRAGKEVVAKYGEGM